MMNAVTSYISDRLKPMPDRLARREGVKPMLQPIKNEEAFKSQHLFRDGGLVQTTHKGRPNRYVAVRTAGVDQVPALLQQGELVIPKKYTPFVIRYLKSKHINLPNT
jgi:hypothetical protein